MADDGPGDSGLSQPSEAVDGTAQNPGSTPRP